MFLDPINAVRGRASQLEKTDQGIWKENHIYICMEKRNGFSSVYKSRITKMMMMMEREKISLMETG